MKLCGDIGGTKALLALADPAGILHHRRRFECARYPDFETLLGAFLAPLGHERQQIHSGCLAVAGPVADDGASARLTNRPWSIESARLQQQFGLPAVTLINDFAATALGVTRLPLDSLPCLQTGTRIETGVRLVVGAGTGLGMATLVPLVGGHWRVLPGEGGHVGFSPADERQAALADHLRAREGRVTWERIVSGHGIATIHEFLGGQASDPAQISAEAMANPESLAASSMALFLSAYGAFAGDMALALMARGGVFLAGGIAEKILPLLHGGTDFMSAFNAKAEHAPLAQRMPVFVVTEPDIALLGCTCN